jgi:hypothetical protein
MCVLFVGWFAILVFQTSTKSVTLSKWIFFPQYNVTLSFWVVMILFACVLGYFGFKWCKRIEEITKGENKMDKNLGKDSKVKFCEFEQWAKEQHWLLCLTQYNSQSTDYLYLLPNGKVMTVEKVGVFLNNLEEA